MYVGGLCKQSCQCLDVDLVHTYKNRNKPDVVDEAGKGDVEGWKGVEKNVGEVDEANVVDMVEVDIEVTVDDGVTVVELDIDIEVDTIELVVDNVCNFVECPVVVNGWVEKVMVVFGAWMLVVYSVVVGKLVVIVVAVDVVAAVVVVTKKNNTSALL